MLDTLERLLRFDYYFSVSQAEYKAQLLYRSCIDEADVIESLGPKPLLDIVDAVGGWSLTSTSSLRDLDFEYKLKSVQKYSTSALFHWYVREGMHNTSRYEIFIHQGGLTLPSRDLYRNAEVVGAFAEYLKTVVTLLKGGSEAGDTRDLDYEVSAIIEFERALADISDTEESMKGKFLSLEEVDDRLPLAPFLLSWRDFFNDVINDLFVGDEPRTYVDGETKVWIQDDYIEKLSAIVADGLEDATDYSNEIEEVDFADRRNRFINTLNNYLTWRAIQPYVGYLSRDFQRAEKVFLKSLHGAQGREERWRTCVMNTNSAMGFAIAPMFVKQGFSEKAREIAYSMIEEIKTSFKSKIVKCSFKNLIISNSFVLTDRLEHLDWLDDPTRLMIRHKINNSTELMGYPDFVLNPAALDERYHDFRVVEKEFLANQVRFHGFAVRKSLGMLAKDVDKRSWPLTFPPSTVNAFYLYPRNQILFPAGVLQPPLFSESQPMSLNFGHIGTFMGHEVRKGLKFFARS